VNIKYDVRLSLCFFYRLHNAKPHHDVIKTSGVGGARWVEWRKA